MVNLASFLSAENLRQTPICGVSFRDGLLPTAITAVISGKTSASSCMNGDIFCIVDAAKSRNAHCCHMEARLTDAFGKHLELITFYHGLSLGIPTLLSKVTLRLPSP